MAVELARRLENLNPVNINNFRPEHLEEVTSTGWSIVKDGLSKSWTERLRPLSHPSLWKPKNGSDDGSYERYIINYHNQLHMMLRQGPPHLPNLLLASIKQAVQRNGHIIGDEAFATWGDQTWRLRDRVKKHVRVRKPSAFPITEADREKRSFYGGFHIVKPGGQIPPHIDGEAVATMNVVVIVDHDPKFDAGMSFTTNPTTEPWTKVEGATGDLLLIGGRKQPWHTMQYDPNADRPRVTFMAVYDSMRAHL